VSVGDTLSPLTPRYGNAWVWDNPGGIKMEWKPPLELRLWPLIPSCGDRSASTELLLPQVPGTFHTTLCILHANQVKSMQLLLQFTDTNTEAQQAHGGHRLSSPAAGCGSNPALLTHGASRPHQSLREVRVDDRVSPTAEDGLGASWIRSHISSCLWIELLRHRNIRL
jgi:hypothetical protein